MTGYGAYFYIVSLGRVHCPCNVVVNQMLTGGFSPQVWGVWLRHCLNGKQDEYDMIWPSWFSAPVVVKRAAPPSLAEMNGDTKKAR